MFKDDKLVKVKNTIFNDENLIKIGDLFWTKEDIPAYEYLKDSHKREMESILPHLVGNEVAVQAGGHCGFVIKELEEHFKRIYTFEPDNTMFLALCLNVPNKNVYKFQACLGERHKMVDMEINPICPHAGAKYVKGRGNIPMLVVDDLALDCCDLLMLDLEGNEYKAVLGASETIQKFHPVLCVERYWGPRTTGLPESFFDSLLGYLNYELVDRVGENKQDFIYKYKGVK
ncbi:MAG: hypothetical protein GY853_01755 [PVC group bacterium]|nr:hypothetical protein [PVC group bacterium]